MTILKYQQSYETRSVTKLKNYNCDYTHKLQWWQTLKLKKWQNSKIQIQTNSIFLSLWNSLNHKRLDLGSCNVHIMFISSDKRYLNKMSTLRLSKHFNNLCGLVLLLFALFNIKSGTGSHFFKKPIFFNLTTVQV